MVNIELNQGIHYKDISAFIKFKYADKYVNLMRSLPVRYWHPDKLMWEVPYSDLDLVITKLDKSEYTLNSDKVVFDEPNEIKIPDDYEFKTKPFQHQLEGIEYGLNHNKFLLGDEQGCIDGDMLVSFSIKSCEYISKLSEFYDFYKQCIFKEDIQVKCYQYGNIAYHGVIDVIFSGNKSVYKLTLENGKFVNATSDHEIRTTEGYISMDKLTTSHLVYTDDGNAYKVISVEYVGIRHTYDIKMQDPFHNFVANGIVLHNCGKTLQVASIACIKKKMQGYKHCLVIACVNGLKYNWQEEVAKHTNETGYILGSYTNKKGQLVIGSNERRLEDLRNIDNIDSYFLITNIETLRYNRRDKVPCKSKVNGVTRYKTVTTFPIVEEIQKLVREKKIGMIVADEVHKCLDGDTLILTDKGSVEIQKIVKQQCYKVATRLDSGKVEYVIPTRYYTNPNPVVITELQIQCPTKSYTPRIYCTHNHKFLLADNTYEEAQFLEGKELANGNIVKRVSFRLYEDNVYDLEIPETHNYILDGNIVVHNCKDSTSLQGKALLSLNADSVVALTGTPLMNNAIDLYTPLKFIGKENHSLFQFKNHYCILGGFGNHQVVGYKNLPELQAVLDKCMLRRLKKDVLDLPEKIYINDYVEMSPQQIKVYTSILEDLRQNIDKVKLSPNPLTMLIRLRQCTGNPELLSSVVKGSPKYDRMLDIVEEVVSENKKAIVFSNWTDVLNPAYDILRANGYQPALYTGQNKDDRESEKQRFKTDPKCKVICGTIGAMGTGLTLTEATTVIFLDEPWNRAIKDQAEDRAHRIGTTEPLNVITIMCKNTIDEKINNIVYRKGKMSDIIVDKEEDLFKNPQMLNYLLSD